MARRRALLLPLALLLLAAACRRDPDAAGSGETVAPATSALAADPRLALLLAPCANSGPYEVDTADPVAILIESLERGQRDPLKAAKAELANCGEPCLQAVRRSLERHWNHPDGVNFVRNALDVAHLADGETARELVVRGLSHPSPTVRSVALRALVEHGGPEQFDTVLEMMFGAGEAMWRTGIPLLHQLDPDRAEAQYVEWIQQGFFEEGWELFAPHLASSTRPGTLAFAREHRGELPPALRPFLAAALARAGDQRARDDLRSLLRHPEDETLRGLAITAARRAELWDELEWSLLGDPRPAFRALAAEGIAQAPRTPERDGLLRAASNDPDPGVRGFVLKARLRRGDEAARDLALAALAGETVGALESGLDVLRAGWDDAPELADRAAEVLMERARSMAHRPLRERAPLLHAIGLVPRAEAARFLVERAHAETGELQGLRAHRWLLLRAGNSGIEGQRVLAEHLGEEEDPVRRLDAIEAMSARGGDEIRGRLFELLEDPSTHPYEVVYAADRLVRMGPTREVLPVLKRAALRAEEYSARTALNCLLWTWYPAPTPE